METSGINHIKINTTNNPLRKYYIIFINKAYHTLIPALFSLKGLIF
ncbi:hypothetical protein [Aquimarina hainanensis]